MKCVQDDCFNCIARADCLTFFLQLLTALLDFMSFDGDELYIDNDVDPLLAGVPFSQLQKVRCTRAAFRAHQRTAVPSPSPEPSDP